jgi:hypothetical protein
VRTAQENDSEWGCSLYYLPEEISAVYQSNFHSDSDVRVAASPLRDITLSVDSQVRGLGIFIQLLVTSNRQDGSSMHDLGSAGHMAARILAGARQISQSQATTLSHATIALPKLLNPPSNDLAHRSLEPIASRPLLHRHASSKVQQILPRITSYTAWRVNNPDSPRNRNQPTREKVASVRYAFIPADNSGEILIADVVEYLQTLLHVSNGALEELQSFLHTS